MQQASQSQHCALALSNGSDSLRTPSSQPISPNMALDRGERPLKLNVTYVVTAKLSHNPNNARVHSKAQIKKLARSIKAFGFLIPVLINRSCRIISGHARVEAAKLLGLDDVPCIYIEHLSDDEVRAFALADNRLAEDASWDQHALALEFKHLLLQDTIDLSVTGFEVPEIDALILGDTDPVPPENDPADAQIHLASTPVTKAGDGWLLRQHRIVCGDARDSVCFTRLMTDRKAAAIITDPPYNVPIKGHASGLGRIQHRDFVAASGEMSSDEFVDFLRAVCKNLVQHSEPGSLHYVFMDWRHVDALQAAAQGNYGSLINICVWDKGSGGMGSFYRSQHEFVLVFKNGKASHRNNIQLGRFGRNRTNVWQYAGVNAFARLTDEGRLAELHPTVKPVALLADAILDCTSRGEIILDAFLGSGSTLIAAERLGRICYGLELDPLYVDVAIRRWQRFTGDFAVHADTGQRFDDVAAERETKHV